MSERPPLRKPEPTSVPGEFYVEDRCCVFCGVPQVAAPDLVGWTDDQRSHCRWIKQPSTADEMERAFAIFDGQELGCHRYCGTDPAIQQRIGTENCDYPIGIRLPSVADRAPISAPLRRRKWSWRRKR